MEEAEAVAPRTVVIERGKLPKLAPLGFDLTVQSVVPGQDAPRGSYAHVQHVLEGGTSHAAGVAHTPAMPAERGLTPHGHRAALGGLGGADWVRAARPGTGPPRGPTVVRRSMRVGSVPRNTCLQLLHAERLELVVESGGLLHLCTLGNRGLAEGRTVCPQPRAPPAVGGRVMRAADVRSVLLRARAVAGGGDGAPGATHPRGAGAAVPPGQGF